MGWALPQGKQPCRRCMMLHVEYAQAADDRCMMQHPAGAPQGCGFNACACSRLPHALDQDRTL